MIHIIIYTSIVIAAIFTHIMDDSPLKTFIMLFFILTSITNTLYIIINQ